MQSSRIKMIAKGLLQSTSTRKIFSTLTRPHSVTQHTDNRRAFSSTPPAAHQTIVIGRGPTGLAFAKEARLKDPKGTVTMIADRTDFTRQQILSLSESNIRYTESLVGEQSIALAMKEKKLGLVQGVNGIRYHIKTSTLETMIHDSLTKEPDANFKEIFIDRRKTTMSLEQHDSMVTLSNPYKALRYDILVAADGARHDTFSTALQPGQVTYNCAQLVDQIHTQHATACYTFPKETFTEIEATFKKPDFIPTSNELKQSDWRLYSSPENRVFMVNNTVYDGTEIPTMTDGNKDFINAWTKTILRYYFPQTVIDMFKGKDCSMEYTAFNIKLYEASRHVIASCLPGMPLDKMPRAIFGAGDALKSPHYHTGSGAGAGLDQAMKFGSFMQSSPTLENLVRYKREVDDLLSASRLGIDSFLIKRATREKLAREETVSASLGFIKPK